MDPLDSPFAADNADGTVHDGQIYGVTPTYRMRARAAIAQRNQAALSAADLHEQAFGEKAQMDVAKLNLAQSVAAANQAAQIERASLARAAFQMKYRQSIESAALVQGLSALDPADPNFRKNRAALMARYPSGVQSDGAQKMIQQQEQEYNARQELIKARDASTYSGQAADVFNQSYQDSNGNLAFANGMAKAEADNVKRAMKLAQNPNLDPSLRSQLFDPETKRFNTDPGLLNQAEVATGIGDAVQKQGGDLAGHLSAINSTLKAMGPAAANDEPWKKDARDALQRALKAASYGILQQANPAGNAAPASAAPTAPATPSVDDAIAKYLGGGATPAPAATPTTAAANSNPGGGDELAQPSGE